MHPTLTTLLPPDEPWPVNDQFRDGSSLFKQNPLLEKCVSAALSYHEA